MPDILLVACCLFCLQSNWVSVISGLCWTGLDAKVVPGNLLRSAFVFTIIPGCILNPLFDTICLYLYVFVQTYKR